MIVVTRASCPCRVRTSHGQDARVTIASFGYTPAHMPEKIEELDPNFATSLPGDDLAWYDIRALGVEGQGWTDTESPFDRLPLRAKGVVRDPVWGLSQHSAGLCIRFVTDAAMLAARWTLRSPALAMNHMPASGVSGLDLYVRHLGAWRWIGVGMVGESVNAQANLLKATLPPGQREYALYLPLYNGVTDVKIGIPRDARLAKAPPRTGGIRPAVFYGTSIVQGGCAARTGMAYPSILGRWLDVPTINLGFSGNGPMDLEMASLLAELDASAYVLDGLPNMTAEQVAERAVPFVQTLRRVRPRTPILLIENIIYQNMLDDRHESHRLKNEKLRAAYEQLTHAGIHDLHYLAADNLLGRDREGTVDGTHPTDVGFLRIAEAILPVLKPLIAAPS